MGKEVWKNIPGYEGLYMASSLGNIKNCERLIKRSRGGFQKLKETILKQHTNVSTGYNTVALSKDGRALTKAVHRLVMAAFHGESDLIVDHKNRIKTDNREKNLRYATQRDNTGFSARNKLGIVGVSINPENYTKRYRSRINVDGKLKELGSYHTPHEAGAAYQNYKSQLQ